MSIDSNIKQFTTPEQCSNGGKNRASKLSPERRKEIATIASHSRKCIDNIPVASHFGKIKIGDHELVCAVLQDGRSVITESSIYKLFGISRGGRNKTINADLPRFLNSNNLQEYIPSDLRGGALTFNIYLPKNGGKAHAYEAEKIPLILNVYRNALLEGKLSPSQKPLALSAEIISVALMKTGIISLIHEATGYQDFRDKNELQRLFNSFIAKDLQPYLVKFPIDFFNHMKRFYGLEHMKKNPPFFGHLINRWVYDEISPELKPELQKKNPVTDKGHRKYQHHRFLTQEIGCPVLEKQVSKLITLMSASDTKEDFEILLEKSNRGN